MTRIVKGNRAPKLPVNRSQTDINVRFVDSFLFFVFIYDFYLPLSINTFKQKIKPLFDFFRLDFLLLFHNLVEKQSRAGRISLSVGCPEVTTEDEGPVAP